MMKMALIVACGVAAFSAPAFADPPMNVDGVYRCVQLCQPGYEGARAYVGQSGWEVNLVNEAGEAATGYIQWPRRIWSDRWDRGAMVSPDGMKIQFDDGKVWIRELPVPAMGFGYR
jgi:hypothetical protein